MNFQGMKPCGRSGGGDEAPEPAESPMEQRCGAWQAGGGLLLR